MADKSETKSKALPKLRTKHFCERLRKTSYVLWGIGLKQIALNVGTHNTQHTGIKHNETEHWCNVTLLCHICLIKLAAPG